MSVFSLEIVFHIISVRNKRGTSMAAKAIYDLPTSSVCVPAPLPCAGSGTCWVLLLL